MFTFRKGAPGAKKGATSAGALDTSGSSPSSPRGPPQPGKDAGDQPLSNPPIEPPTPSPFRAEPSSLPLVVENAPTPVITGKEMTKKGEAAAVVKKAESQGEAPAETSTPRTGGGGAAPPQGALAPVVTVGKSSRAPMLRLKQGSRVKMEGLKARSLIESGSKFFTFGAKKEPDMYVRLSMGNLVPPCRTKAVTRVNKQGCDWGDEAVEFVVTEEITRLVGPELKLTVQVFSEGQKGNDVCVGSTVVDLSDHLNQGPFTATLVEGKKAKGELDLVLTYLLPGLLAIPVPIEEEGEEPGAGGDEALPPQDSGADTVVAAAKPDAKALPPPVVTAALDSKATVTKTPSPAGTPVASAPVSPLGGSTTAAEPPSSSTPTKRKSVTISLPHEAPTSKQTTPSSPVAGGSQPGQQVATTSPAASPTAGGGGGATKTSPRQQGQPVKVPSSSPVMTMDGAPPPLQIKQVAPPVASPVALKVETSGVVERRPSTDGKPAPTPSSTTKTPSPVATTSVEGSEQRSTPIDKAASSSPAHATGRKSNDGGGGASPVASTIQGGSSKAATPATAPSIHTGVAPAAVASSPASSSPAGSVGGGGGLEVTQGLAQAMLVKVKEDAAANLREGLEEGDPSAVRRMMDKIKEGVAKDLHLDGGGGSPPLKAAAGQQQPATGPSPPGSGRRPSLKLDLGGGGGGKSLVVAASPLQSPSPYVQPATAAAATAPPQSSSSATAAGGGKAAASAATPTVPVTSAAATKEPSTTTPRRRQSDAKEAATVESEDSVLMGTAGTSILIKAGGGLSLTEVMESMAEDDKEDEEFFLGIRPASGAAGRDQTAAGRAPPQPLEPDVAVTRLQAAWRRKTVSRHLRREQLQARRIQALYRGHRDRKEFNSKLTFLKKLELDERKRQERQKRLMNNHRELALLRITPALELGQMDQRRREFAARRIQHFVRKRCLLSRRRCSMKPSLLKSPTASSSSHRRPSIPEMIDRSEEEEAVQDFVSTYKRSLLSPRSYAKSREGPVPPPVSPSHDHRGSSRPPPPKRKLSAIRLADLHRKVISSSRAKDKRDVLERFESALAMGVRGVHAAKNPQSGAQVRYQRLLESRYEARLLLSARQEEDEDRSEYASARRDRVGRFRRLLDQLEAPPTLNDLRQAFGLEEPPEGQEAKEVKAVPDIVLPWRLPRGGKAVRIAEEAHRHALETMQEKQSRWWVTPLPEDLAEPPVDIRAVHAPSPFAENIDPAQAVLAPGLGCFDEDEASLWWYAYARKGVAGARAAAAAAAKDDTGPATGDVLFQRARLGRAVLREKNSEDAKVREAGEDGTARDLVKLILKERRKRLSAAALAKEAEERKAEAKRQENAAAVRIQASYRGSAVRKRGPLPRKA